MPPRCTWEATARRLMAEIDLATVQRYVDEGQFGAGSMLPKVQAAMSGATGTVIHS